MKVPNLVGKRTRVLYGGLFSTDSVGVSVDKLMDRSVSGMDRSVSGMDGSVSGMDGSEW